ncbi:MAG: MFS transporter [Pseudomonadota bacterium]
MVSRTPLVRTSVTAMCFLMAVMAWGTVFYGHSVYMDQLMRDQGWSASLISSAILVFWIASLPGTLFVGLLVDKLGPAPVVAMGGLCIGGGLIALSEISTLWHLYAIYIAMGFGYPALAAAAISATLVPWFSRGFGAVLGVALTGASVGGALVPVWLVQSSAARGFDLTVTITGSVVLVMALIIASLFYFVGRPASAVSASSDQAAFSARQILTQWKFWLIAIAAAFGLGGQVGFLAHQVPMIAAQSDQLTASLTVTVIAIASALGRLIVGLASRWLTVATLAMLSYLLYGAGIAVLVTAQDVTWTFVGCAIAGLFVGAIVMLPPILVREVFGANGYGRTYAMVNVVMYVFAGLTPWFVGLLRDQSTDYTIALWMLVAMEAVAALLILRASRHFKAV